MNWKNWPYWGKGLSTGLVAGVLISIYLLFNQKNILIYKPACLSTTGCEAYTPLPLFYAILIGTTILFSIIGILIGYLCGKIKNQNRIHNT